MTASHLRWALVLGATLAAAAHADTRVYRCDDAGAVTYSDLPCANARVVAIQAGAPAADAVDRLRRDQDRLDAGAQARREALARAAALARIQGVTVDAPSGSNGDEAVYAYAYSPFGTLRTGARRHDAARDRDSERKRRRPSVITQPPPTPLRDSRR